MSDDPVYYRIYQSHRDDKLAVVCMQSFDECDYQGDRFLKDDDTGERMRWDDEDEAKKYLNAHFKTEFITPDDIIENHHNFRHMRRDS